MRVAAVPKFFRLSGLLLAAQASAALAVQSAPVSPPRLFEPVDQWTVDYAENMCVVSRQFRSGDQKITLGFRPTPTSENFRVALFVTDETKDVTRGMAKLIIDNLRPVEEPFARGPIKIAGTHLINIDSTRAKVSPLASAKSLQVTADTIYVRLKLGNIGGAMKALDKCENDLLVRWGMDPAVLASIKTRARLQNPSGLFSHNDYPSEALAKNEQGISYIRFLVGIDGRARNCSVVESSKSKALDAKTCDIYVNRARYEPARTASGDAVSSIVLQRMHWEMPE